MYKLVQNIGNSSLFILSNTVVIVPYFLFIQLVDSKEPLSILPFVIFYCCRMTGIFFIRGFHPNKKTEDLLLNAIILGLIGSLIAIIGKYFFICYFLSGIFLGFSASWLPMANTTIKLHMKNNNISLKTNNLVSIILLSILFLGFTLDKNKVLLSFTIYAIFYLFSYLLIKNFPSFDYEENLNNYRFSLKFIMLFTLFFLLLLFLRSGRLLNNINLIIISIFSFLLCLIIFETIAIKHRKKKYVPLKLSYLSILNGIVGNYLFLFSSIYISVTFGKDSIATKLYLPYVLGIILAPLLNSLVINKVKKRAFDFLLFMMIVGFLLMLYSQVLSIGLFLISISKSSLNLLLNNEYYMNTKLAQDQRLLVKYTTQSEGSLLHQFFLMIIFYVTVSIKKDPVTMILNMVGQSKPTGESVLLMNTIKEISIVILIFLCLIFVISDILNSKKTHKINELR